VVRDKNGEYIILNGNQTGCILEYYILKEKKNTGTLPENAAIVKTIVTTDLQDVIAHDFGVKVFNVLTGFKYICQKMREFDTEKNYSYVYGGEESYGYLVGALARDKDSVSAALMIAECAAFMATKGLTVIDLLNEIYEKYGLYLDELETREIKGLSGKELILKIMEYFRKNEIKVIGGIEVARSADYENERIPDAEGSRYILPPSNVIQYFMKDGSRITLRPSGTEPKIKFYFSTKAKDKNEAEKKVEIFKKDFMEKVDRIIKQG
jgi:phosphoglucomutase